MLRAQLLLPRNHVRCKVSVAARAPYAASRMQTLRGRTVLHQSGAVHKPRCDRRTYQHAELPNGVRVLLIQDLDAVYAAASANVQIGYFDDPGTLPGQPQGVARKLNSFAVKAVAG
jgi:hypothetical protein